MLKPQYDEAGQGDQPLVLDLGVLTAQTVHERLNLTIPVEQLSMNLVHQPTTSDRIQLAYDALATVLNTYTKAEAVAAMLSALQVVYKSGTQPTADEQSAFIKDASEWIAMYVMGGADGIEKS